MAKVNIEDIRPGMVLGEDVAGQNGQPLAPRDTLLDEAGIRVLRAHGVRVVDVRTDAPTAGADPERERRDAVLECCRELLRPRFAALDLSTPFGATVFELAVERAAARPPENLEDLAADPRAPVLSGLPPEKLLFGPKKTDPASLVSGEVELATLPEVHVRLLQALRSESASPRELAAIIGRDPGLSAKLLKLVNSPAYGARDPVDTIGRAVTMVGLKDLTTLVLGLAALSAFSDISPGLCDMRGFWGHAAACGVYASLLAAACPGTAPERVFVGGLLHDIGQLVIMRKLPAAAGRALLLARIEGIPTSEAETAILGFDHAAVGRALLRRWNFPESLTAMVAGHHQPDGRPESRETALVHAADILATAFAWPAFPGPAVPPLSEAAWRSTELSETMLAGVAATGGARIAEIESAFFTGAAPKPR